MIYYGFSAVRVLALVVIALLFLYVIISVATFILERKTEALKKQLEELERQMAEREDE